MLVGLISYPLYLWHWPLFVFVESTVTNPHSGVIRGIAVGASVALAWVTWKVVEKPFRRPTGSRLKAVVLAMAMIVLSGCAYVTFREKGFPSRFPRSMQELAAFSYDPTSVWRDGEYFLRLNQDETSFPNNPAEIDPRKPSLFLWGDSHAAALYAGVNYAYAEKFNVVQRTAAGVPPFMGRRFDARSGVEINRYIFEAIRANHPDVVILDANWPQYEWRYVEETIIGLKELKIRQIIVVGPVPEWAGSLPQVVFDYVRKHPAEPMPLRMTAGARSEPPQIDASMKTMCDRLGVAYVSPCSIFGGKDGFLIRTGDTADTLVQFDYGHLTATGAKYLVSHFPSELLPAGPPGK